MKAKLREAVSRANVPAKLSAAFRELEKLGQEWADMLAVLPKLDLSAQKAFAEEVERRVVAYDRRQFKRFGVPYGDWKQLALKRAALPSNRDKNMHLKPPSEFESLSPRQWEEMARMMDANWQKHMANPDWRAALMFGRPKVKLSAADAKAMRERKISAAQMSKKLAKKAGSDELAARRIRYADRQARARAKVVR